jgi:hypothetical protein
MITVEVLLAMQKQLAAIVALGCWIASFLLWYHYAFSRPVVQQLQSGRIHPLNTHGSIVYLTTQECVLLYGLMALGAICFFLVLSFHYLGKHQSQ